MAHKWGWKPDRDFLYQAYVVERRSILDIARELHCRNGNLVKALREYGISRPHSYMTKKWMIDHYIMRRESIDDIAEQLDITEAAVRYYLRDFDIPIRYKSRGRVQVPELNDYDWLYEHYITRGLSYGRIAEMLGCHEYSVFRACTRLGVPRKHRELCLRGGAAYRPAFSPQKRARIYERDGYQCQMPNCGATERLHVHHIVPRRLGGRNLLDNGITLCEACHMLTLRKEKDFAPLFQSIVASHHQEPPT